MRNLNTDHPVARAPRGAALILAIAAAAVLAAGWLSPAGAQRVRIREADTLGAHSSESSEPGDVRVEIKTGRDSLDRVVVRSRRHRTSSDSTDLVRMGESITVEPGQEVPGDVVAIGGTVHVLGHVRGDAVSIGGDVILSGDGAVDGDAVSVGGTVKRGPGTRVGGQNIGMRFIPSGMFSMFRPDHRPALGILFHLVKILVLFFIGWLLITLGESRVRGTGGYLDTHLWKSLLTGIAILVLYPAAFVLLLVTVVGIPLGLLSPVALAVAMTVGYLVTAILVGQRVLGGTAPAAASEQRGYLIKGLALGLLVFEGIPLVGIIFGAFGGPMRYVGWVLLVFGWAVIFVASTIGLGALVLSRFGRPHVASAPPNAIEGQPAPAV